MIKTAYSTYFATIIGNPAGMPVNELSLQILLIIGGKWKYYICINMFSLYMMGYSDPIDYVSGTARYDYIGAAAELSFVVLNIIRGAYEHKSNES